MGAAALFFNGSVQQDPGHPPGFEFESVCSGGANNGLTCSGGCPGGRCEDLPTYWAGPADSAGERMDVEQLCGHSDTPQAGWPPIGVQGALRDMNGDGLPDYVDSNVDCDNPTTGPGWRVFINTGTNFKQSHVTWAGTAGLLVQQWGAQDDATPGVPDPADVAVVIADTLDVDGDGIADHIEAVPSDLSRLYVRRGLGAIPGTLSKQENGLGGSIEVTYGLASAVDPLPGTAPKVCNGGSNDGSVCKWVTDCPSGTCDACTDCDHSPFPLTAVAQITTKSGLTGTGHTLTQSYKFLAPYYDWQEREFRGFRWAVEEDAARDRRTETEFVQPGTHPRQQSTWCGAPGQSCTALVLARFYKGKVRSTRVRALATAKLHADSSSTWEFGYLSDPRQAGQNSVLVRLGERTQRGYGSVGATSLSRRETFAYDAYNNLTESQRYDGAVLTSKTQTTFEYQAASWIVDRPTEVRQLDAGTTTLARRTATYNAQGNPVLERRDLDANPAGGTGTITVATYAYSGAAGSAGQSTSVTDARGNVTTLAYADTAADYSCDSRGLYPCKTTNHLGHAIRRSYALRFGTMTEERDANDARTKLEYDALGRLTKVFRGVYAGAIPGDVKAWREFSYYLGSAGSPATPTRIDVKIREEAHASGYRTEARFHDGLGRFLATKAEAIVTGAAANVVREAVGFDSAGRVAHQYPPYGGGMALTSYDPPSGVATSTVFDLLDRPTQVTAPDGNARTVVYDPAGVTDLRDENYVACNGMPGTIARASCPGQRTVEQRDALGRLLTVSIYEGATLDSQTINEYDALDRLTSTKLAADEDSKVTFTYDSFGRRIGLRDKNSGTWSYGYDHSGNLIYQDDPKTEQHLEWCVDALNRPTNKRSFTTDAFSGNACGSGGTVRTSFAYDSCTRGVGRLCEENSPGRQVLTRTYTARGLVGTESRSIDAAGPARSLTYSFNYDEADRLKNVQYPTSVSATNETLTYSYDAAGQLVAAATPGNTYLAGAQYDLFGRSTRLDLGGAGSGSTSELRTYFGASGAYRLQQLAVLRASTALQTWNYELPSSAGPGWDRAGNLLKIDDVTPSGQYPSLSDRDNEWTYTYDGLGRLTNANWAARAATASFDHDALGNLTAGNFAFPGVLTTTAVTFTHDPDRPHQIDWSAPPGSGSAYAYESGGSAGDGNGGLTSRPATAGADAAKSVLYDVEGRVQRITVGGDQVESVYDDAGQRIARIVNGTDVTLFFGRFVEVRGATLTRHVFAGARRIAFSPIAAPPTLTLAALPDDHPEVRMARAEADAVWLSSLPGPGLDPGPLASAAGTAVLVVGTLVLVWIPTGRRRVGIVGVVRRGRVGALVALYVVSLPPWPERPTLAPLLPPVAAQCPEPTPSPATTVHADHLGSTTLLTNYGDGAVQQYYRYGAYGRMNVIKPDGTQAAAGTELTELTYTGQRWDAHARSYYYGARHYDPAIGRFLTIDPARQFANPYTYVGWRPTMLVDPTGRDAYTFALLTGNDLAESYQTYGMIPGGSTTHGSVGLDGDGNQQVSLALGPPDPGGPSITAILFGANASAEGPNMSLDPSPSGANILDGGGGVPSLSAGYVDANGTVSLVPLPGGFYYGVTLGYQASYGDARGDQALYLGIAASYGPSVGGSVTFAPGQQINEGLVVAASYVDAQGRAAQFGYGLGTATGRFGEIGPGRSSGAPISGSASVAIGTQTLAFFEFLAITGDPSVGRR